MMTPRHALFATLLVASLAGVAVPAVAQREQDSAYKLAKDGAIMQLGDILAQVSPRVGGKFIGSEFDADHTMYRLRYMDAGKVKNVDVDARTGRILGRSF